MNFNRFLILSNRDSSNILEYKYAWFWVNGYSFVDARYLYLGKSKDISIDYMELFMYKLYYLNPNATPFDVYEEVSNIVRNKTDNGTPVYVTEEDVMRCSSKVYESIPSITDLSRIVKLKNPLDIKKGRVLEELKHVEFKKDIRGLLQLNKKEMDKLFSLKKKERDNYMFKVMRDKKRNYAKSIVDENKRKETSENILSCVNKIAESKNHITYKEVADMANVSVQTAIRYIREQGFNLGKMQDSVFFLKQPEVKKLDTIEKMREGVKSLNRRKEKVNKTSLSKEIGISRVTITKYWNEIK